VPWILTPGSDLKLFRSRFRQVQVLAQPKDQGGRQYALLSLHRT